MVAVEENGLLRVVDDESGKVHTFEFDVSYGDNTSQLQVFTDVKPLAMSVLDGYNVCIFAYGQTGSGYACNYFPASLFSNFIFCVLFGMGGQRAEMGMIQLQFFTDFMAGLSIDGNNKRLMVIYGF